MFGGIIVTDYKFGTSGWRAQIADQFTFKNVSIIAQAIADYIKEKGIEDKGIFIGYDNRFLSPEFAQTCAEVMAGNGIKVYLSDGAIPTPVVSYAIVNLGTAGAINITASHNSGTDNGIKYNDTLGNPASKEICDIISQKASEIEKSNGVKKGNINLVQKFNPKQDYITHLLKLVDIQAIKEANLRVVVDDMFGCGIGYTEEILESLNCQVTVVNNRRDPLFGGRIPDVNTKNMEELIPIMKQNDAVLGLGTDGDADRFGIIDKEFNFITPNQVLYLLMDYLIKTRGWKTSVSRTVATTYMLDRLGQKYGIEVTETPVGFKYIAEGFMYRDAFLGGEESGGLSIKGHVPEKDGILACLLIVEMVAKLGKSPTMIMEDLKADVGYLYSGRLDIHCTTEEKEKVLDILKTYSPSEICNKKVTKKVTIDGVKFVMEDGSWTLIRASGTEPLFRIYAEGNTEEQVNDIHKEVKEHLGL